MSLTPHAFLITAYKDEAQLRFLVAQLLKYPSKIFLHVDKKSRQLQRQLENFYAANSRVVILKDPVKVYWGGFSHLQAILNLLQASYKDKELSRFHLISGQDLPIRPVHEFENFFSDQAGEFISCFPLPDARWRNGGLDRISYYHLNDIFDPKKYFFPRLNGRFVRLQKFLGIKRKMPACISSYHGGGTWWSLGRNAAQEIFGFLEKHPSFIKGFRNTYCAEEIFFHTILSHTTLKENIADEDLRYIDWSDPEGKFPPVLDESYLEKLQNSGKFFARKFDSGISEGLRKRLENVVKETSAI